MVKVKFVIPKGSLWDGTMDLLRQAFYEVRGAERTYRPVVGDPEIELKIMRPQEIPLYVAAGYHDIGITGRDWLEETGADVEMLADLGYGKVKLVAAAPAQAPYESLDEMLGQYISERKPLRISTEYLNLAGRYIKSLPSYAKTFGDSEPLVVTPWWRRGENEAVKIYLSFGATEAKPPEEADAIVDVTVTGATLAQNNLKQLDVILESSAMLVANKDALKDGEKSEKIYDVLTLLKGVVESRKMLHIFVNVEEKNLEKLVEALPALKGPTISRLSKEGWYAVNTVVSREDFLKILPTLRRLAQGLVVHDPRLILPLEEIARKKVEKGGEAENP